jgi:serine/threonine protein kinase
MFLATSIEFFLTMIKLETTTTKPIQCPLENQVQYGLWHLTYFIVSSDSNNSPRIVANSWGKKHWPGTKDISVAIGCNDPTFVNFLEGCLRWDKNQRLSPDELMQHSWIVGVSISLLDLNSTNP